MEEEILQEMIRDRETQIKMMETKLSLQSSKFEKVRQQLQEIKDLYSKEHVEHTMSLEASQKKYQELVEQIQERLQQLDMRNRATQQGPTMQMYNEIMKDSSEPIEGDSSYVLRMQAQLCKAMHSMGMLDAQFAMLEAFAKERPKHLKEMIARTTEEKSQAELNLMNHLIAADVGRKEVEEKHKAMIESFTKEKDALVEKIEKQQEKESDEEPEEDDEEEKEELKEILSQGKEEIERLEKENMEELKTLEELKAKVAAVRGEPFVEELVATIAEDFKEREEDEDEEEDEDD